MLGRVVLGASLALNLVLGGVLVMDDGRDASPNPRRLLERMERLLPDGDRTTFEGVVAARQPALTAARAEMRWALGPIRDAIAAEPFDPAVLRAAMARGRVPWNEFSNQFDSTLVAALTAISPEGRRRVARDMPGPGRDEGERRGGDAAGGRGPGTGGQDTGKATD